MTDNTTVPKFLTKAAPTPGAPPGGKLTIHDFLRLQVIERWTIINKVRRQSVAEHSWMVTVIALFLYQEQVGCVDGDNGEMLQLVCATLFHDAPEARTGDIPTPGKRYIQHRSGNDVFDDIDTDLIPVTPFIGGNPSVEIERFIKLADLIEAVAWIRENGVGEHARVVAGKLHEKLAAMIERCGMETGFDWYGPVNKVMMALGAPVVHHDSWIHKL